MQEANLGNMKFVRDGDQNLKASHLTIYFSFTPLSPHCYTVATLEGLTFNFNYFLTYSSSSDCHKASEQNR